MPKRKTEQRFGDLYPPIIPFSSGFLSVDETHTLYWEQCGNPEGVPVLVLHGGPGAGVTSAHRRFFDPEHYRIILFDQRGSGRSTPLGEIKNNTKEHLVSDIESLRKYLKIKRWHIFGGSWGATLALLYGIAHPKRCISFILRAIFLLQKDEIDWFLYGIKNIFPENWEHFSHYIPENERDDLLGAYYRRLKSHNPKVRTEAGLNWSTYESSCLSFYPKIQTPSHRDEEDIAYATSLIEAHYFKNETIPEENSILKRISALKKIPCSIIQGRYDIICPVSTAYNLHKAWPEADYIIVPDGGHSALDVQVCRRLVKATEHAKLLT
ncbi:MAG: prolyl aminopeptidase [Micavibrio sp.]|nr:prolyl aminopeptidase [Micavibrio sp.]